MKMRKYTWINYFKLGSAVLFLGLYLLLTGVVVNNYLNGYQKLCGGPVSPSGSCLGPVYKNENPTLFYEYLIINNLINLIVLLGGVAIIKFLCRKFEEGSN